MTEKKIDSLREFDERWGGAKNLDYSMGRYLEQDLSDAIEGEERRRQAAMAKVQKLCVELGHTTVLTCAWELLKQWESGVMNSRLEDGSLSLPLRRDDPGARR